MRNDEEMREIRIPGLNSLDTLPLKHASEWIKRNGARAAIDTLNWEAFPRKPICVAYSAYSATALYILFEVEGDDLRANYENDNSPTHEDSCVEFFVKESASDTYFNFEFNCIGTCFASERLSRTSFSLLSPRKMKRIRRMSSLGNRKFKALEGEYNWWVMVTIPFDLINLNGTNLPEYVMGNFYKCGDLTPHPHYLTWNPIDTPQPDYHRPEFFGKIVFGERVNEY
ncbi:carbohydrate-binding family 9-like protein [Porphyromonadaceae bacterium]